jgi:hypothetical protein
LADTQQRQSHYWFQPGAFSINTNQTIRRAKNGIARKPNTCTMLLPRQRIDDDEACLPMWGTTDIARKDSTALIETK